jgi:hypothetical protein
LFPPEVQDGLHLQQQAGEIQKLRDGPSRRTGNRSPSHPPTLAYGPLEDAAVPRNCQCRDHLPNKEIQQTAFEPTSTKSGFGAVSAQSSSQLRIAFRGTYRTMQRAFLELETRMPQLQLQELRIDPSSNQSSLLNFQVSYTAWEN